MERFLILSSILLLQLLIGGIAVAESRPETPPVNPNPASETITPVLGTAHDFTFVAIDGTPLPMMDYAGKVVLIVNTASQCGFTDQYEGLQSLYEEYGARGLVVIGVPSNDFGGQEPAAEAEIQDFAADKYGITFPMTQKYTVKGKTAHPFYQWAASQGQGGLIFSKPRWNFHKYLVAPDGTLAGSYGSQVAPDSTNLRARIEEILL
jgi:glutathione peroxidase